MDTESFISKLATSISHRFGDSRHVVLANIFQNVACILGKKKKIGACGRCVYFLVLNGVVFSSASQVTAMMTWLPWVLNDHLYLL